MKSKKSPILMTVIAVLLFSQFAFSAETVKKPAPKNPDNKVKVENLVIFDKDHPVVSDWSLGWGADGHEADIKAVDGGAVVTGLLKERSFAAVHKNLKFDIDQYPEVEINIKGVSSAWYFIASGSQIKDGYVKLQPDTQNKGIFKYNLKKMLGLSGVVTMDLQIGVSIPDGKRCDGETVTFGSLVLIPDPNAVPGTGVVLPVKSPSAESLDLLAEGKSGMGLGDWLSHRQGQGDESAISRKDGNLVVEGVLEDRNFAAAFKNISCNIDDHPVLKIEVASITKNWFIILSGPLFKEGYVRVQPDTDKTGLLTYNLKNLFNLSGKVAFDLQLGISDPDGKSCKGIKLTVSKLSL
jgi:hypothetical protein